MNILRKIFCELNDSVESKFRMLNLYDERINVNNLTNLTNIELDNIKHSKYHGMCLTSFNQINIEKFKNLLIDNKIVIEEDLVRCENYQANRWKDFSFDIYVKNEILYQNMHVIFHCYNFLKYTVARPTIYKDIIVKISMFDFIELISK